MQGNLTPRPAPAPLGRRLIMPETTLLDLNRARLLGHVPDLLRIRDLVRLKFQPEDFRAFLTGYAPDKREFQKLWQLLTWRRRLDSLRDSLKACRNRVIYRPLGWR